MCRHGPCGPIPWGPWVWWIFHLTCMASVSGFLDTLSGAKIRRPVFLGRTVRAGVPLRLAALPVSVEVCYIFVTGVWEVELLVARDLVGCIGPAKVMRLMCIVLTTLLTLLSLLKYSFVDASSLLRMCLRASRIRVLLSLGGMLFWVTGRLFVVMVRGPLSSLHPWTRGFPLIYMVSYSGFLIPLGC